MDTKYSFPKNNTFIESDEDKPEDVSAIESQNSEDNYTYDSKIVDFNTFNFLKERNFLQPFSIMIEAPILHG